MKLNNKIVTDEMYQANYGHLHLLVAKAINKASETIWQGGQGDSPSAKEEEMMEDSNRELVKIAREIYIGLTGCIVKDMEEVTYKRFHNYQLGGMISFNETQHQTDVGRIYMLLSNCFYIIEKRGTLEYLEEMEAEVELMHYAKEIFLGLTGNFITKLVPQMLNV